ncbi:MAG: hypothetical protein ABI426_09770 [Flavobacterium sp.]
MKTFIFSLGIFALFVSPASCSKGKLHFPNTSTSTDNSLASKEGDDECTLIIDPTKPIPKP